MKTLAEPGDKVELVRRLRTVRPGVTHRWGRMSVHQMVCHLADAFRMAIGDMVVSHDAHLFNRTILKSVALYVPLPWPRGIMTRPEIDQVKGCGTKPTDFAADLALAEAQLELFTATAAQLGGRAHPVFGPMSEQAWLRWGYLHTDHHLRQFGA